MYTQEDLRQTQAELIKRMWIAILPCVAMVVLAVGLFALGQQSRQEWGWQVACALSIVGGAHFLFFYGVYARPVCLYRQHLQYMLEGRKRETIGILQAVEQQPVDKEGLDFYTVIINVGERGDPEDERLLYYDVQLGQPAIAVGVRVRALSNDKVIAELCIA